VIWVNAIEKLQQRTWSLAEKTKLAEQLKLLTWRAVMKKSVPVFGLTL
jgi:hypothetical protein